MIRRLHPTNIATLCCAALAACLDTSLPPPPGPGGTQGQGLVLTFDSVTPPVAQVGDTIAVKFAAGEPLTTCAMSVAGHTAVCAPTGNACACTIAIVADMGEGDVPLELSASSATHSGTSTANTVAIDQTPPTLDGSLVARTHAPLGTQDRVTVSAGAGSDGGPAYTGKSVKQVAVFDAPTGGTALVVIELTPDGTGAADLPGTEDSAPPELYAEVTDAAGLTSARGAIAGNDVDGPQVTASARFVRNAVGTADQVVGDAGALADDSAVVSAELLAAAGDTTALATLTVNVDGSFDAVDVGDGASAPATLFVRAVDKCGNAAVSPIATGAAIGQGVLDASRIQLVRRPLRSVDGVVGGAGAFTGTCAAVTFEVVDAQGASAFASGPAGGLDGSFPEIAVGTTTQSFPAVTVRAVDKCGLTSTTVFATGVDNTAPTIDATRMQIVRRDFSAPDGVSATAGAIADAQSAPARVDLFDAASSGNLVAQAVPAADGSFVEVAVGTSTASFPVLFASAIDKAQNASARVPIDNGSDLTAPAAVDGSKIRVVLRPPGVPEQIAVTSGAESDGGAFFFRVFTQPVGGAQVGPDLIPDGAGALALTDLADVDLDDLFVAAVDKAGNTSSRSLARNVTAVLDGRTNTSDLAQAIFTDAADLDPVAAGPGYVAAEGALVDVASLDGLGAIDAGRVSTAATSETASAAPAFTPLSPTHAPADGLLVGQSNAFRGRDQIFGFNGQSGPSLSAQELSGDDWVAVPEQGARTRSQPPAFGFDPVRRQSVLFGGSGSDQDTQVFDGAVWSPVATTTNPGVFTMASAFDTSRGVLVVFGGLGDVAPFALSADTWEFDGAQWTQIATASSPPARRFATMVYDAARDCVVLFGGLGAGGGKLSDTWEYRAGAWSESTGATHPSALELTQLVFDPIAGGVLLFAGLDASGTNNRELWRFDGSWSELTPSGAPSGRDDGVFLFDASARRFIVEGGVALINGTTILTDTNALTEATPHDRFAAQAMAFELPAAPSTIDVDYVGAGLGSSGGVATPGVELRVFDFATDAWVVLGSNAALDGDAASSRTIAASVPAPVSDFVSNGRFWLLASATFSSSPGVGASVSTDFVNVTVDYVLP